MHGPKTMVSCMFFKPSQWIGMPWHLCVLMGTRVVWM
jgi:hypothetical protein